MAEIFDLRFERSYGGGQQYGGGVGGAVVEVDFFDEADGELVVGEEDVDGGVQARRAVLAQPPEGEGAKDGEGLVGRGGGAVRSEAAWPRA